MVEEIHHPGQAQLLEQLGELRPDTLQHIHLGEQRVEDLRAHERLLACDAALAMRARLHYMRAMLSDAELKRLHWRAHHRGTREADAMIGGFFDSHHRAWGAEERNLFAALLEEQDVDIMAWALGTASAPERFDGPMLQAMKRLDYIRVAR